MVARERMFRGLGRICRVAWIGIGGQQKERWITRLGMPGKVEEGDTGQACEVQKARRRVGGSPKSANAKRRMSFTVDRDVDGPRPTQPRLGSFDLTGPLVRSLTSRHRRAASVKNGSFTDAQ
jgi:hypothetical protein